MNNSLISAQIRLTFVIDYLDTIFSDCPFLIPLFVLKFTFVIDYLNTQAGAEKIFDEKIYICYKLLKYATPELLPLKFSSSFTFVINYLNTNASKPLQDAIHSIFTFVIDYLNTCARQNRC